MVMKTKAIEPKMILHTQNECRRRSDHIGQDPVQQPRLMHGRALRLYQQNRVNIEQMQRRIELEAANSIRIDVLLLTGDLDEDITILNIVA